MMRGYSLGSRECKVSGCLFDWVLADDICRMIIVSIYCLAAGHPGLIFKDTRSALETGDRKTQLAMEEGVITK